jgi:hypothetical protein
MSDRMRHTEWKVLADRVLHLDGNQLHAIVLEFLSVTDAGTATTAIDKGLAMNEQHMSQLAAGPPIGGAE